MANVEFRVRRGFAKRRKALGFTQETLAARLGVERSTVVRWEAGKSEPSAGLWPKLATFLKVTPEQLTDLITEDSIGPALSIHTEIGSEVEGDMDRRAISGTLSWRPAGVAATYSPLRRLSVMITPGRNTILDNSSSSSNDGGIYHLRRVLMGCIPDTPPGAQLGLAAAVTRAWDLFFLARFDEMKRTLPDVLASAYCAAEVATGESRRQVNILLAQLLHASSNLLGYVAQEDLAALALLRADALAAESEDELTLAAIKGSQSWLLAKNGMYDDSAAYAERAAVDIEPRLSAATPRHVAIWGELLCYAAFAASRAGDYPQARRYLRLCESAEGQLEGDYVTRPEASNMFGRTSAASFGVVNEMAADQPREALKLAVGSDGGVGVPPVLRSRRLVNVAHAQVRNRDDMEAVNTLRQACLIAPELFSHIPLAHTLTNELLGRGKQRPDGLVVVAKHLGVSV
ncbi:helix-turn-helix domain-containing protein [Nocardia panacis]|uniref:helix-turn-helix domain-containing protein n=1 Tax=Nocardia panacis TaxID=2340916 RepID=UPI0013159F0B|nr:helix-turn-helix transcriptional regulator [Nocardia panacis]